MSGFSLFTVFHFQMIKILENDEGSIGKPKEVEIFINLLGLEMMSTQQLEDFYKVQTF